MSLMWDSGLTAHLLNVAAEIRLVLLTASTSVVAHVYR